MSLPYVLEDSQVKPFNFYHQGQARSAIFFKNKLYVLAQAFSPKERLDAYNYSYEMGDNVMALMTAGKAGYRLWTALQAPASFCMV